MANGPTRIPAGHPDRVKLFTVAIFGRIVQAGNWHKSLTGSMSEGQSQAESNLSGSTSPTLPIVRLGDLNKRRGDRVSINFFDTLNGKPIPGTRDLEGREESITSSSQEIGLNQVAKGVKGTHEYEQGRVEYEILKLAEKALEGWWARFQNQMALVHLAGSRGTQIGRDWVVPLNPNDSAAFGDEEFDEIMVNPVLAPTYNRHLVIDGNGFVQGGQQLGSIDSTDTWTLDHFDHLVTILSESEFPMQPIIVPGDEAAYDDPIMGLLYLTRKQMQQVTTQSGGGRNWETFARDAMKRRESVKGSHPLWSGTVGYWRGLLIKQLPTRTTVAFDSGSTTRIITQANQFTATETNQTVGIPNTHRVERALLLCGQAAGYVWGSSPSNNYWFELRRKDYNYGQVPGAMGIARNGMQKLRFKFRDKNGQKVPTDHGVIVIDSAVSQSLLNG